MSTSIFVRSSSILLLPLLLLPPARRLPSLNPPTTFGLCHADDITALNIAVASSQPSSSSSSPSALRPSGCLCSSVSANFPHQRPDSWKPPPGPHRCQNRTLLGEKSAGGRERKRERAGVGEVDRAESGVVAEKTRRC